MVSKKTTATAKAKVNKSKSSGTPSIKKTSKNTSSKKLSNREVKTAVKRRSGTATKTRAKTTAKKAARSLQPPFGCAAATTACTDDIGAPHRPRGAMSLDPVEASNLCQTLAFSDNKEDNDISDNTAGSISTDGSGCGRGALSGSDVMEIDTDGDNTTGSSGEVPVESETKCSGKDSTSWWNYLPFWRR